MSLECVRCGKTFDTASERTMHVIRQRCSEIESGVEADAVDDIHALQEALGVVGDE